MMNDDYELMQVDFTETGICHGFVLWIDWVLDEEDGIVISTGPGIELNTRLSSL